MSVTVFLADDHAFVREGLRLLLEAQPDIRVLGIAEDGHQAVRRVIASRPNVAVLDISMPILNGIEAAQQIRAACPNTQVIILSMHASSEYVARAFQAGALGYLLKESASVEVANAVRAVSGGQPYISPQIESEMVAGRIPQPDSPETHPLDQLSAREKEVMQLVVEGHTNPEIAALLHLSQKTVESYRSRLMTKLGVKDLPGLVKLAIQYGLTSLD